jgi:hypothetical protein
MGRRPSPTGTPAESSGGWQDVSFDKSDVLTVAATNPVRTKRRYSEIGERLLEGLPSVAREPISAPGSIRPNGGRVRAVRSLETNAAAPRAVSGHVAAPRLRGWPMSQVSMPATGPPKTREPRRGGQGSGLPRGHSPSFLLERHSSNSKESATCQENPTKRRWFRARRSARFEARTLNIWLVSTYKRPPQIPLPR